MKDADIQSALILIMIEYETKLRVENHVLFCTFEILNFEENLKTCRNS